jgi:glycosyltransferase involved in cell wall biosynthesis
MKIVHAVYSLEMGGAEVLVAQLCRLQRTNGHTVSVCVYSTPGELGAALRAEGFHIEVLGEAHPAVTLWRYFQLFRRIRPDVVHCHNPAPTLQAAVGARLAGASCVVSTRHSLVNPPYDFAAEAKYSIFSRACDWVVGICDATCENLRRAPLARRARVVRVYNGVNPIQPVVSADPPPKSRFTLVFVGRFAEVKNLKMLICAVGQAVLSTPHLQLWLVGDGPTRPALEDLTATLHLSKYVTFWGQRADVAQFFSAADLFVMTSVSEGLPMSLLQAMSVGLPTLTTDVGGMAEVVRLSQCGILVPVGDVEAFAIAIIELAGNPERRAAYGLQAAAAYRAHFALEQMAAAYMQLYRCTRPMES